MSDADNILIVSGAFGTGKSLVLAMLNARPDVFVMYEVQPYKSNLSDRSSAFLARIPDLKLLDDERPVHHTLNRIKSVLGHAPASALSSYARIQDALATCGFSYRIFGDKVPTLDWRELSLLADAPNLIFTVRDIRTWLCESKIFCRENAMQDAVAVISQYMNTLMHAVALDHALVLRTEDLVLESEKAIGQIVDYLQLPDSSRMDEYWMHLIQNDDDPKSWNCPWKRKNGRPTRSAAYRPMELAVEYELRDHKLWDIVLPVFDKYYRTPDNVAFSKEELESDKRTLNENLSGFEVQILDLFKSFRSWRYIPDESDRPVRTNVWQLLEDGRLLRPASETHDQLPADVASQLISEKALPQFLMVEQEHEPFMAVKHTNIFGKSAFRKAMKQSGTLIVRVTHETARAVSPDISQSLHPIAPSYFYRPSGRDQWRLLPDDLSLEMLIALLEIPPKRLVDSVRQKALAKAADGVHTLNEIGINYNLRKTGNRKFANVSRDELKRTALQKAEQGVATLKALGFSYELTENWTKEETAPDGEKTK